MNWTDDDQLLVTGATGFVGSHVADRARKQGIRTRALVRRDSKFKPLEKREVAITLGSMTEPYAIRSALQGVTHVVHCAAKTGHWGTSKEFHEINVTGLEHLLEAIKESKTVQRLVHISSLDVYGAGNQHSTEELAPLSRRGADAYALSKIEAEEALQLSVKREKLNAVVLRPGLVYGSRDRRMLPRIIRQLRSGRFLFFGDPEQTLPNCDVRNLVDAVFLALESDKFAGEAFNITDPKLVTKQQFVDAIAEPLGLPKPTRKLPLPLGTALATGLEALWRFAGREQPPPLSRDDCRLFGVNLAFSCEKAQALLGYNPQIAFEDGIKTAINWARKTGLA